jgi:hypothetical protein
MGMRSASIGAAVAILVTGATLAAQSRHSPSLPELLAAAGIYIADYEARFSVLVSEERYEQTWTILASHRTNKRLLRSDVMTIDAGAAGWVTFRDVFEVDGVPVRDHADRLTKLATEPPADAFDQATRLAAESARFNLGNVTRTINTPTVALLFLRTEYQSRSRFRFHRVTTIDGLRVAELTFNEQGQPSVIRSADNATAEGTFWLEPGSGRVVRTALGLKSAGHSAKITVHYANRPGINLWVPVWMDEEYKLPPRTVVRVWPSSGTVYGSDAITGHAEYENFRKFTVNGRMIIR